jgi:hypothetical protein
MTAMRGLLLIELICDAPLCIKRASSSALRRVADSHTPAQKSRDIESKSIMALMHHRVIPYRCHYQFQLIIVQFVS